MLEIQSIEEKKEVEETKNKTHQLMYVMHHQMIFK